MNGLVGVLTSMVGRTVKMSEDCVVDGVKLAKGLEGVVVDEYMEGSRTMCSVRFTRWGVVNIPMARLSRK